MNHRVSIYNLLPHCGRRARAFSVGENVPSPRCRADTTRVVCHVSHVTCDPRHGARTVDALPASVYNHTVARPDLRHRAPDPDTFSQIIGNLTIL